MELGRVADIDNAKVNNIEKSQKVAEVDNHKKVQADDKYKNAQGTQQTFDRNEVILDNVKFGYNKNSQDFFVKVTRGEAEYKYPTEDMMRVKAQLLQELKQKLEESK
ncbi:flagellin [Malaciobacter halophilus]|uniref:Flagellin n=1 Tax=Malaciobacter halophilus TaxID=197482 RepID=A0A2N1IZT0_9BACT|nr:flagellin [Malaciobacter halophilus]AXH10487.1 FlaG family protein [Malaciobacter halophilus]PKI79808.1 flagellin [Malaciobacter halophilus]